MGSYRLQVQLTPTYNGIVYITTEMVYAGIIHKLKYHFDKPTLTIQIQGAVYNVQKIAGRVEMLLIQCAALLNYRQT